MRRMLGIIMALLLFAAPAVAQNATVEGDWELIAIVIEGVTYENLAQQGMLVTMRLEADGTGVPDGQRRRISLHMDRSGRSDPD